MSATPPAAAKPTPRTDGSNHIPTLEDLGWVPFRLPAHRVTCQLPVKPKRTQIRGMQAWFANGPYCYCSLLIAPMGDKLSGMTPAEQLKYVRPVLETKNQSNIRVVNVSGRRAVAADSDENGFVQSMLLVDGEKLFVFQVGSMDQKMAKSAATVFFSSIRLKR